MTFLARRALFAAPALLAAPALAQGWSPTRAIRMIAPYSPGGGVDTTARLLAGPMGAALGQAVTVDNRAGAGGSLGAAELARSPADGHTIMVDAMAHTVNPALIRGLSFDYATAFTPISQIVVLPQIMIAPLSAPGRTLQEYIAHLKTLPAGTPYGSSGNATAAHLAAALLCQRAGLRMEHVPYRGGTAAIPDLIAGNISFVFGTVSSSLQLVREGRVKAFAVSTAQRIAALPDVPTVAEQGFPGYELNEWNGLYAPAGLPEAATTRIYQAMQMALADNTVKARLEALGAMPLGTPPAEFARYVVEQRTAMAQLVREAGIEAG
jgi:tripartite-type tricarboxylate transporter receptor subunit TctC